MLKELKKQVLKANLELFSNSLAVLTWGNVSGVCRKENCFVIKPSGVPYPELTEEKLVVVSLKDKSVLQGDFKPSSDTDTHFYLYNAFSDIGAVVHTHSPYAAAWAQAGREIPVYGTTHADFSYTSIPCTRKLKKYEVEKDYELNTGFVIAEHYKKHELDPKSSPAVLVSGHGPFIFGKNAKKSVENAVTLEAVAQMAFMTEMLSLSGSGYSSTPQLNGYIREKHFSRKHGDKAYYGQGSE